MLFDKISRLYQKRPQYISGRTTFECFESEAESRKREKRERRETTISWYLAVANEKRRRQ